MEAFQNTVLAELAKLPKDITKFYYSAMEKAPQVARNEFPPEVFARCEDSAHLAAERIASFWNLRYQIYGEDRYYRSIQDLSGDGVLRPQDIQFLKYGNVCLIPTGNILVFDLTNIRSLQDEFSIQWNRQAFYYWSRAAINNTSLTMFCLVREIEENYTETIGPFKKFSKIIPTTLNGLHICCICSPVAGSCFQQTAAPKIVEIIGEELNKVVLIHSAKSKKCLLKKLQKLGFSPDQLTSDLGGKINCQECIQSDLRTYGGSCFVQGDSNTNDDDDEDRKPPAKNKKEHHETSIIKQGFKTVKRQNLSTIVIATLEEHPLLTELVKLPNELTKFYYMAAKRNPEVVQIESTPELFSRCETLAAAAKRMALYWKFRYNIYGESDFCKSILDLSGNGILQKDDIDFLMTGVNILLPNNIVVVDHSRLSGNTTDYTQVRKRGGFFLWTRAALQGEYVVILRLVQETMKFDRNTMQFQVIKLLQDVVPVKLKEFHVCCLYPTGARKHFEQVVAPQALSLFDKSKLDIVHVHVAKSLKELSKKLEVHGLLKKELPPNLGGSFDFYKVHLEQLVDLGAKNIQADLKAHGGSSFVIQDTPQDVSQDVAVARTKEYERVEDDDKKPAAKQIVPIGPIVRNQAVEKLQNLGTIAAASFEEQHLSTELAPSSLIMDNNSFNNNPVIKEIANLPNELTKYFYNAFNKAPDVVKVEGGPDLFIKCEKLIPLAAERMVKYWKCRYEIYGETDYYKSLLDLSGNGIFQDEDIRYLTSGMSYLLPNNFLFADQRNIPSTSISIERRKRHSLYLSTQAAQRSNKVSIFRLVHYSMANDTNLIEAGPVKFIDAISPVRIKEIHLCCICTTHSRIHFERVVVPRMMLDFGKELQNLIQIHIGKSEQSLSKKLEKLGYPPSQFTPNLGGTFDLKKFLYNNIKQHGGRIPDESNNQESCNNSRMEDEENDNGDRKPRAKAVQDPKKLDHPHISSIGGKHPLIQEFAKLPKELSKFYYMAAERNPEVVQVESAPELFARCETTLSAAANRMALYWKFRYIIYGETDFCKSVLDLSGNGILQKDDIEFLETGVNILLPNNVVVVDHSRLSGHTTDYSAVRKRGGFFLWTRAALQGEYVTIVRLVQETMKFDRNTMQFQVIKLLQDVVPVKLKEFHVCCLYPTGARKHFEQVVAPQALSLFDKSMLDIVHVHVATTRKELCKRLEMHGMKKKELPPNLGGSCNFYKQHLEQLEKLGSSIKLSQTDRKSLLKKTPPSANRPRTESNLFHNSKGPLKKRKASDPSKEGSADMTDISKNIGLDKDGEVVESKASDPIKEGSADMTDICKNKGLDKDRDVGERGPLIRVKRPRPLDLMDLAQYLTGATEYQEACQEDPEVVSKESDPCIFLRLPNPASRLAGYWKRRKEWFGPDRAFRSILDLSGQGALSLEDIHVLREGNQVNIPDDKSKHKVFFWKTMPRSVSQMRCLMHWMTNASLATSLSQDEGIVLILTSPYIINNELYNLLDSYMPVKIHAVHICCLSKEDASKALDIPTARVHAANSLFDILPKLLAYGFTKKNLPFEVGGLWKYDSLHNSLQEQQDEMSTHVAVSEGSSGMNELESLTDAAKKARIEERKKRKRKNDALYAHKRRLREKKEEAELQESYNHLTIRNTELKAENARLQELFKDAKGKIALVEYGISIASSQKLRASDNLSDSRVSSVTSISSEFDSNDDQDTSTGSKQRWQDSKAKFGEPTLHLRPCNSITTSTPTPNRGTAFDQGTAKPDVKQTETTLQDGQTLSQQNGINAVKLIQYLTQNDTTMPLSSPSGPTPEQSLYPCATSQNNQATMVTIPVGLLQSLLLKIEKKKQQHQQQGQTALPSLNSPKEKQVAFQSVPALQHQVPNQKGEDSMVAQLLQLLIVTLQQQQQQVQQQQVQPQQVSFQQLNCPTSYCTRGGLNDTNSNITQQQNMMSQDFITLQQMLCNNNNLQQQQQQQGMPIQPSNQIAQSLQQHQHTCTNHSYTTNEQQQQQQQNMILEFIMQSLSSSTPGQQQQQQR